MKTWEEIFKDRLGEREIPLPDESLAEFQAKLDSKAGAPAKRQTHLVWIAAAVAASLAAFVFLHRPAGPEPGNHTAMQPSAPVAVSTDSTAFNEPEQDTPPVARAVKPKVVRQPYVEPQKQNGDIEVHDTIVEEAGDTSAANTGKEPPVTVIPPFVPESAPYVKTTMKVGPAAGIIAGSGLLAAFAMPLVGGVGNNGSVYTPIDGSPGYSNPSFEDASHCFPLKLGLSFRIPVAGRFNLTTGLEYSMYTSHFTYSLPVDAGSGHSTQYAHYLGIPLRLDWTLASNRGLDVYVGGGFEADYCIGAVLDGKKVDKDGFGLSLLGAGGIQLNLTGRIGLYVEPEISWTIPSGSHVLYTYRSDHPLMFSLASGVRISLGK